MTTTTTATVKFHLSLNVSDLDRAVTFYQALFQMAPAKHLADYAKFELVEPPVVLSLEPSGSGNLRSGYGALNHLGIRLADSATLVEMQRRLELAGFATEREEGVECCYARQTKFWVRDLDANLWEFYVLEEDIEHRGIGQVPEKIPHTSTNPDSATTRATATDGTGNNNGAENGNGHTLPIVTSLSTAVNPKTESLPVIPTASPTASAAPLVEWEHRLTEPFPESLPFPDQTVGEVRLRGTFNEQLTAEQRVVRLREVSRVLLPGGRLLIHCLTADQPGATGLRLPGPAAVVQQAPHLTELLHELELAGFVHARLTKYGAKPCFQMGSIGMRETMLQAFQPATAAEAQKSVVYLGPFLTITDDTGRTWRRGEPQNLAADQWHLFQQLPTASQFLELTNSNPNVEPKSAPVADVTTVATSCCSG